MILSAPQTLQLWPGEEVGIKEKMGKEEEANGWNGWEGRKVMEKREEHQRNLSKVGDYEVAPSRVRCHGCDAYVFSSKCNY